MFGTETDIPFYIKLVRENNITDKNEIGITLPHSLQIIFLGNDSLNINSPLPPGVKNTKIDPISFKNIAYLGKNVKKQITNENKNK